MLNSNLARQFHELSKIAEATVSPHDSLLLKRLGYTGLSIMVEAGEIDGDKRVSVQTITSYPPAVETMLAVGKPNTNGVIVSYKLLPADKRDAVENVAELVTDFGEAARVLAKMHSTIHFVAAVNAAHSTYITQTSPPDPF